MPNADDAAITAVSPLSAAPLAGYTVGVTADRRATEQIELLERRGAAVVHAPTIRLHPLADEPTLAARTCEALDGPVDLAVLVTAVGTRNWVEAAEALGLADALLATLRSAEVYVRGAKALGAASTLGLPVAWAAPTSVAELRDRLLQRGVAGARIVVQLDGTGNEPMLADLEAAGATVVGVPVYRWTLPEDTAPAQRLVRGIVEQRIDAVTFTTRTALTHLFALAREERLDDDLRAAFNRTTTAVCVGPVSAARACELGIGKVIQPTRARLGSMVYEFAHGFDHARVEVVARDHHLYIQGRLVVVDGDAPLELTERERGVLLALAEARGRVLSKDDLLGRVWGPGEHDTHVAEVVVARLRRRLGGASGLVETVHRRGYRLATT